jgi:glycosyltransferase involved in cell wall biosynthesis
LANRGAINWPLYHLLNYPLYASFNRLVYKQFKKKVVMGEYDMVHAITPMMPRYPVKLVNACQNTPFLLGPVNGGVPFPKGFEATARKEFAHFNFLRIFGRHLIPGYKKTYTKASKVLVGSTYTKDMLKDTFNLDDGKLTLFYENGIEAGFVSDEKKFSDKKLKLLFVGRLVPYKGADMMIDAINSLPDQYRSNVEATIVGDGPEKHALMQQAESSNLAKQIQFTGWVNQKDTLQFYKNADVFCFPSIREFGGAVVLEAMAGGLPCIVVNNGGIGEYVTEKTGYKIDPVSRQFIVESISDILMKMIDAKEDLQEKSRMCIERAKEFQWANKASAVHKIYENILSRT